MSTEATLTSKGQTTIPKTIRDSLAMKSDEGVYVCFTKAHASPSSVDAFSRALKQFKQTDAFQTIYRKYFP